jgi:hypothetical protein
MRPPCIGTKPTDLPFNLDFEKFTHDSFMSFLPYEKKVTGDSERRKWKNGFQGYGCACALRLRGSYLLSLTLGDSRRYDLFTNQKGLCRHIGFDRRNGFLITELR